jgi:hypothetical protein
LAWPEPVGSVRSSRPIGWVAYGKRAAWGLRTVFNGATPRFFWWGALSFGRGLPGRRSSIAQMAPSSMPRVACGARPTCNTLVVSLGIRLTARLPGGQNEPTLKGAALAKAAPFHPPPSPGLFDRSRPPWLKWQRLVLGTGNLPTQRGAAPVRAAPACRSLMEKQGRSGQRPLLGPVHSKNPPIPRPRPYRRGFLVPLEGTRADPAQPAFLAPSFGKTPDPALTPTASRGESSHPPGRSTNRPAY